MTAQWLLAFLHLLALPIGLAAIAIRARALHAVARGAPPRAALNADMWWGMAAVLWISTGLVRYMTPVEKGTDYYSSNTLFMAKLTMLSIILILEVWPMITLIGWRIRQSKQQPIDTARARTFATISIAQALLVVLMVAAATGMARGIGAGEP